MRVLLIRKDFKRVITYSYVSEGLRVLLIRKDFKLPLFGIVEHSGLRVLLIRKDFKRSAQSFSLLGILL